MRSLAKTCKPGRTHSPHSVPLQVAHCNQVKTLFNWFGIVLFAEQQAQSSARCWQAVRSAHSPILQRYPHASNNPIQHRKRKQGPSKSMKRKRKFLSLKNIHVRQYSLELPTETMLYWAIWDRLTLVKLWIFLALLRRIVYNSTVPLEAAFSLVSCVSLWAFTDNQMPTLEQSPYTIDFQRS